MGFDLKEIFADYAHKAWAGWMKYLFSKCEVNNYGSVTIPKWAVDRWVRQMNTPYVDLSQAEQRSDLAEADKMLGLVNSFMDTDTDNDNDNGHTFDTAQYLHRKTT